MFSAIWAMPGEIMAMGLKSDLRLSGSSVLPAYCGFMLTNTPTLALSGIILVWMKTSVAFDFSASIINENCCAITESTSICMRLNSSRQDQEPHCEKPEKKRAMVFTSKVSEQLNTMQY